MRAYIHLRIHAKMHMHAYVTINSALRYAQLQVKVIRLDGIAREKSSIRRIWIYEKLYVSLP